MTDRRGVLLKATYDILKKCSQGPYVKDVFYETAIWDEVECDGLCLFEEIAELLGEETND